MFGYDLASVRDIYWNNKTTMQITRWEPFREIDRFFDNDFLPTLLPVQRLGADLATDVYEEDHKIVAKMSLADIAPGDLDVSIEDDILTISGKREDEKEISRKNYYSKEIRRGAFSRSINLSKPVDARKAEAAYENGLLVVSAPIIEGNGTKAVKVKIKG